jgi:lipopolysaccharide transport system ATP-binding protein
MNAEAPVQAGEIRARGLGRLFKIRLSQNRSLKETILRRELPRTRELWALRDVDLEIHRGETFGIVGPNGSGKSTLLKLIAGIFAPSTGRLEVAGRVGSLIEIGAGFHPEFTGVENVYLNAAIYGLKRSYVDEHLDEIIGFAELEQFKDVPVRTYSSGMYMRLGFSVAMHIQPDVLLLDEVLAVGDLQFQERCLDRIRALHADGRTILLVSHDLTAVAQFCTRVLWLHDGQVRALGAPAPVLDAYRRHLLGDGGRGIGNPDRPLPTADSSPPTGRRWGSGEVELTAVELLDAAERPTARFATGAPLVVRLRYRARRRVRRPVFGIAIYAGGLQLSGPNTRIDGRPVEQVEGEGEVRYRIAALPLLPGAYTLSAAVYDEQELHPFDHHHQAYPFQVASADGVERYGLIDLAGAWEIGDHPQPSAVPRASSALSSQPPATDEHPRAVSVPAARLPTSVTDRWPAPPASKLDADG